MSDPRRKTLPPSPWAAKTAPVGTRDVTVPALVDGETQISIFQNDEIRKIFHKDEWWYSVSDIVRALIQSEDPGAWKKIKSKLKQEGSEVVADCDQLKMPGKDGKYYLLTSLPLCYEGRKG